MKQCFVLKLSRNAGCFLKIFALYLKALSQRFQVAKMLTKDHVYSDIVNETGASTATISRVNRSLSYDGSGGYNIVFDRLDKKEDK